ncbi:sulfotransferase [Haliea sp. E1-2-M8]|uniref:tetratricopeptide repeat-containing sulfotransferase family protein n=1 Tax=Haliea sp. E1-2-M8 TaxID=3064706 RepID=UPI00272753A9|nr:tetratricopeptide repeat-containing sulfotransferase family protein [Haliea sp. E1-2-M8]MDO8861285.1 sulfotransferase [Haliea sp. E1-2-M8]
MQPLHRDDDTAIAAIRASLQRKVFDRALRASEQQLALSPDDAELWALKGQALQGLGRWTDAEACFLRGLEFSPGNARLLVLQGHLYTRLGRGEDAVSCYTRALARDPGLTDAYRGLLNFRAIPADGPEVAELLALALNERRTDNARARALFLLGQIFVDAGMDHPGFAFFRQANALVASTIERGKREYQVTAGASAMTAEFFRHHARSIPAAPACPAIIVAGLPRSGKSLVENLLSAHPLVSAGGELALVRKLVGDLDQRPGLEALAARLSAETASPLGRHCPPLAAGARYLVDTSPANLGRLGYLALLHPEVPIIFCRREVLDHGLALYFKNFRSGHRYSYQLGTTGRAIALAEKLICHWRQALPNPMFEVHYEELVRDPQGTQQALYAGLGLPPPPPLERPGTGAEWRVFPSRSIDSMGSISAELVGFADRFRSQLEPLAKAYAAEIAHSGFAPRATGQRKPGRSDG